MILGKGLEKKGAREAGEAEAFFTMLVGEQGERGHQICFSENKALRLGGRKIDDLAKRERG